MAGLRFTRQVPCAADSPRVAATAAKSFRKIRGGTMTDQRPNTTTDSGIPVGSDEYSLTAGPPGPPPLRAPHPSEKHAHPVTQRAPHPAHTRQGVRRSSDLSRHVRTH